MTNTQIETMKNNFILPDSEIGDFVSEYRVPDDVFETVIDAIVEASKREPEVSKKLAPIDKMHFMCDELSSVGS